MYRYKLSMLGQSGGGVEGGSYKLSMLGQSGGGVEGGSWEGFW